MILLSYIKININLDKYYYNIVFFMEYIYIIIDKYIYNLTEFNKYSSIKDIKFKDYNLKDGTQDIIIKYYNDDTFNLFKNVKKYKTFMDIDLICLNIFKKDIPDYFRYFKFDSERLQYLNNMKKSQYILVYDNDKKYIFYKKINMNNIIKFNLIFLSNNWCYYSKKGIYNSLKIEDLVEIVNKIKIE